MSGFCISLRILAYETIGLKAVNGFLEIEKILDWNISCGRIQQTLSSEKTLEMCSVNGAVGGE